MPGDESRSRVHSEDYFGDGRDYWWNADYLAFLARERWKVSGGAALPGAASRMALDVGTGFGHFMRALAPALPPETQWVGIDPEAESIKEAHARTLAVSPELARRARFRLGRAEAIPFHDGVFDFVACQTVLIHVRDPEVALREMIRVLAPGGLLVVVEPDNLAAGFAFESRATGATADEIVALFRLQLLCERGKKALGEGDNSLGAELPGALARLGLELVDVALNDRAYSMIPPYVRPHERAELADLERLTDAGHFVWRYEDTERYYVAGGGKREELPALWELARRERTRIRSAIAEKRWSAGGGHVTYVVAGRKPR